MRHTTGENKRVKTKSEELENLFGTLLLDLGSRIEDNEINIKFATNFKAKYKSRFEKIIENNVTLGDVSKCSFDCENPVYEKGASYCDEHMRTDSY